MTRYLLDSDVLIWLLRGRKETLQRLEHLEGPFAVSVVSRAEIWAGARASEHKSIEELFLCLTTHPVDAAVADLAGHLINRHSRSGHPLELPDAMIAATAIIHDQSLVTYNTAHFPMPELRLA